MCQITENVPEDLIELNMSKIQAYEWYKAFKQGQEVIVDLPHFYLTSTSTNHSNINKI